MENGTQLTKNDLIHHLYDFGGTDDGKILAQNIRFLEEGSISGYWHPNERFWEIEDNQLVLLDFNRNPTSHFSLTVDSDSLLGQNI